MLTKKIPVELDKEQIHMLIMSVGTMAVQNNWAKNVAGYRLLKKLAVIGKFDLDEEIATIKSIEGIN